MVDGKSRPSLRRVYAVYGGRRPVVELNLTTPRVRGARWCVADNGVLPTTATSGRVQLRDLPRTSVLHAAATADVSSTTSTIAIMAHEERAAVQHLRTYHQRRRCRGSADRIPEGRIATTAWRSPIAPNLLSGAFRAVDLDIKATRVPVQPAVRKGVRRATSPPSATSVRSNRSG